MIIFERYALKGSKKYGLAAMENWYVFKVKQSSAFQNNSTFGDLIFLPFTMFP